MIHRAYEPGKLSTDYCFIEMGFFSKIIDIFRRDSSDWDELEELMVTSDMGIHLATRLVEKLREEKRSLKGEEIVASCKKLVQDIIPAENPELKPLDGSPKVVLVVGVNGTGKTTSTAKLGHHLKKQGYKVMFAAADTFRAAAIEQLDVWSRRLDIPIIKGVYHADPSSVCYEAYDKAKKEGVDFLLCDTAGRLHNRFNLMEELKKIGRTLGKKDISAPHEVFLVVDATTGSNALSQAREFHKTVNLTGLIVTKLDGSGKGGSIVAISDELKVAPRYIGTGEQADDFKKFDLDEFIEDIL